MSGGIGARIFRDIEIGIEFATAGKSEEIDPGVNTVEILKKRQERAVTAVVRMRAFERRRFAIEPAVGISRIEWESDNFSRNLVFQGGTFVYGPWHPTHNLPKDEPTWGTMIGVDVPVGGRRVQVVPSVRARMPFRAEQPAIYAGVGVRFGLG